MTQTLNLGGGKVANRRQTSICNCGEERRDDIDGDTCLGGSLAHRRFNLAWYACDCVH